MTIGTENYVFPHAAFTVYLNDTVVTDRVVITITADNDFTLGEIEILGENV